MIEEKKLQRRYERNSMTITPEENKLLRAKKVCVAGCGGLGGGVIEGLVRIGVGTVRAIDGDVFDETNLNRQVLSNEGNLGRSKAEEAVLQMKLINSEVRIDPVYAFIDESNAAELIRGFDAVVDALDNISSRKILERACESESIPLVHGAIAGWNGQVSVVMPGDRTLAAVYEGEEEKGEEVLTGNPYFTPAVVSAIEVAETVKLLLAREGSLISRMLTIDLLHHEYETIDFGE